jgi:hypothetical protein
MKHHPITHDGGKTDLRYAIGREFCGKVKPQFVVRFCDEFIGSASTYLGAVLLAVGYKAKRNGAQVFVNIPA